MCVSGAAVPALRAFERDAAIDRRAQLAGQGDEIRDRAMTPYSGIDANGNATTVAAAASLGVSVTTTPPTGATAGLLT